MKKFLFFVITSLLCLHSFAGVSIEENCFQQAPVAVGKKNPFLLFRSYFDDELQLNVGGFVSYNNSKSRISLMFYDEVQGEGPTEGDYQKIWLELIDKKVTGQYVEHGSYTGNPGGKYIKYTNFSKNKSTIFRLSTIDSPCVTVQ